MSSVPDRWSAYDCADYFASPLAREGWYDDYGCYWYIEPASRLEEDLELRLMIIGGPGADGIRWGYRRGHQGIWAFYPISGEFRRIASSASELRSGYESGRIMV